MLKKALKAKQEGAIQESIYNDFKEQLTPENVESWTDQAEAYEANPQNAVDPYYHELTGSYSTCIRSSHNACLR